MHGHDRHNTTIMLILHNMSTTCFGQHYFWSSSGLIQLSEKTTQYIIWYSIIIIKVKWFRYRPGVAQRVGTGIALLFHDRGTRRGWVVTPRQHFTPGRYPVPIFQEAGWAPRSAWTAEKSRSHRDSILDRPARSQCNHCIISIFIYRHRYI